MAQRILRKESVDITNENSNTTGYTSLLLNGFQDVGSNAEQWLSMLRMIEDDTISKPTNRKKYIRHFFDKCWRVITEENRYSKTYAILRAKEAWHYSESDVDLGRDFFKSALNVCRRVSLIYINYAQFELEQGRKDKAKKILLKSREFIESNAEIDEAMKNIELNKNVISNEVVAMKICKLNPVETAPVLKEIAPLSNGIAPVHNDVTPMKPVTLRGNNIKEANSNIFAAATNSPKTPNCETPEPLPLKETVKCPSEILSKQKSRFAALTDLKSPISPSIAPTSVQKRNRFRPSNSTWSCVKGRDIKPLKHETPLNKTMKLNTGSGGSGSDSTTGTKTKARRVLMIKKSTSSDEEDKENQQKPEEKGADEVSKPSRVRRIPTYNDDVSPNPSTEPPMKHVELPPPPPVCNSNAVVPHKPKTTQSLPKPVEANHKPAEANHKPAEANHKPIEACHKTDESELNRMQSIIAQANHAQQSHSKSDDSWRSLEIRHTRYLLMKLLGRGGSSKVFQAWDTSTKSIVAIKQVHLSTCDRVVLEGYLSEVKYLQKLQGSPHIIKLFAFEVSDKYLYLAMECGSTDFQSLLKTSRANNTLTAVDIIFYWNKMLRCVQTIHKHGIIHLDLKPANFLLVGGTLKLIDFGIANSIQTDVTSVTKDTQFGTLNYMAPETINDISTNDQSNKPKFKVGSKADVWSLGCILYLMMYGCTPFQHIRHQALKMCAITNPEHKITFPSFQNGSILRIVQACLQRDPKIRPSIDDLLTFPIAL